MRELGKIITVKPEPETTPSLTDIIQKEKAVQTVSDYLFTTALRGHFKRVFDCVVNRKGQGFWVQAEYGAVRESYTDAEKFKNAFQEYSNARKLRDRALEISQIQDYLTAACEVNSNLELTRQTLLGQFKFDTLFAQPHLIAALFESFKRWKDDYVHAYRKGHRTYCENLGELAKTAELAGEQRAWELISKAEVEERLGYAVTELPRDEQWGDLNLNDVKTWVCIPAKIQYTIWSDIYRCDGFVTIEEPTAKVSIRGKNKGKPITVKKRVHRGCGQDIIIWEAAIDDNGEVAETFKCPHCTIPWKKWQIVRQRSVPVLVNFSAHGIKETQRLYKSRLIRCVRRITSVERNRLSEIETKSIPYWIPTNEMDPKGPRYRRDALQVRKIRRVTDFWTHRNLWAYALLWERARSISDTRIRDALQFALTAITYYVTKKQAWGTGGGGLSGQLFISSFPLEKNVFEVWQRKIDQLVKGYSVARGLGNANANVSVASATKLVLETESIDYIFTDPPFGSNIYYSEPNLLWEAWLGKVTDTAEEAVVHRKNDGGTKRLSDYARLMQCAFAEMFRVLKPGRWCTVEFNNSDGAVFETIKQAVRQAGFEIVNMLLFDKTQKTFQQVKGAGLGVVDMDVVFNLHKPSVTRADILVEDTDLEQLVTETVRHHLQTLPDRMKSDPSTYNDEHRTTATINSMLMNTLIPKGVSVVRLNLPFIEHVCGRYFRKIGQRWYLRGEAVAGNGGDHLVPAEVTIKDELTGIDWLRQTLHIRPMLMGELKPLWQRATGLLSANVSQTIILEDLLSENFWRDAETTRWREPTVAERERMNDDRSLRVLHDAERYVSQTLRRDTTDEERCEWIDVLFQACRAIEDNEADAFPALRGFNKSEAYALITRLFQSVLRDHVSRDVYSRAEKQARAASQRLSKDVQAEEAGKEKAKAGTDADQGVLNFEKNS
jgi:hypothetical protein